MRQDEKAGSITPPANFSIYRTKIKIQSMTEFLKWIFSFAQFFGLVW